MYPNTLQNGGHQPQTDPRQKYQPHHYPPQGNPMVFVPLHTQAPSRPYNVKAAMGLGITQIAIGCNCIILNSVMISFGSIIGLIGYGIWGGLLFILAGILQVISSKTYSKGLIVATMVMAIISACATPALLALGIIESYIPYHGNRDIVRTIIAFAVIIAVLAVLEAAIAIATSVLCCEAVCQCYGAQPQTAGNQPVVFVSNDYAHRPVSQAVRPRYPFNPRMPSEIPSSNDYVEQNVVVKCV